MSIIDRLLSPSSSSSAFPLSKLEVIQLCFQARREFLLEPMLLELPVPINICGDIHGQFDELQQIFQVGGMPGNTKYLFLGDYVDRGPKQLETICLLFAFKVNYPQTFHLLRGNHEEANICSAYGFIDECIQRLDVSIFYTFISVFDCMPVAAIVAGEIFCVHGGISPDLKSMDQIRSIQRPVSIPSNGLLCDLVWSDPDTSTETWQKNHKRGTSWLFGPQSIVDFLTHFKMDVIVRAHEVVPEGYQFFAGLHFVTIFSTTNNGTNEAVFMKIDEKLQCTFHRP